MQFCQNQSVINLILFLYASPEVDNEPNMATETIEPEKFLNPFIQNQPGIT